MRDRRAARALDSWVSATTATPSMTWRSVRTANSTTAERDRFQAAAASCTQTVSSSSQLMDHLAFMSDLPVLLFKPGFSHASFR